MGPGPGRDGSRRRFGHVRDHKQPPAAGYDEGPPSGWAQGFIIFAAVMMILAGSFQAFAGLVAVFDDEFYVTTPKYVLQFDSTSWGWIHLLMGLVVLGRASPSCPGRPGDGSWASPLPC